MKNLKTLVIVRHGHYSGEDLNDHGVEQMKSITEKIKTHISEGTFVVLTSAAPRAKQSAEVISQCLGIKVNYTSEAFWSDNRHRQNDDRFLQELEENVDGANHAILVSHLEYVEEMPYVITKNEGFNRPAMCRGREKGEGVLINFETQQVFELRNW